MKIGIIRKLWSVWKSEYWKPPFYGGYMIEYWGGVVDEG